jgi:predicted RNase H-related nuclease YkuK (DUF458 family)
MWLSPDGLQVEMNDVIREIMDDCKVFVGTDSQLVANQWQLATAICIYREGKGGKFFYKKEKLDRSSFKSLEDRLMREVYESVMTAEQIKSQRQSVDVNIHADIASDPDSRSSKLAKTAKSYISGMGYEPTIKPDAWASTTIADKFTR